MKTSNKTWLLMRHAHHSRDKLTETGNQECMDVIEKIEKHAVSFGTIIIIYDDEYNRTEETARSIGAQLSRIHTVKIRSTSDSTGPLIMTGETISQLTDENTLVIIIASLHDIPDLLFQINVAEHQYDAADMADMMGNTNFFNMKEVLEITETQGSMSLDELEPFIY